MVKGILDRVVCKDLSEEVMFVQAPEPGPEGSEATNPVKTRRQDIPSRGDKRVKQDSDMERSLTWSRKSEANVAGQSEQEGG